MRIQQVFRGIFRAFILTVRHRAHRVVNLIAMSSLVIGCNTDRAPEWTRVYLELIQDAALLINEGLIQLPGVGEQSDEAATA